MKNFFENRPVVGLIVASAMMVGSVTLSYFVGTWFGESLGNLIEKR